MDDQVLNKYIREMYDEDEIIRVEAINQLGEIGDELCLRELRERLKFITCEHQALIIAVGKLKKKLGVT